MSDLTQAEEQAVRRAVMKLNSQAWGVAIGLLCGLGLFIATLVLVVQGGPNVGQHLSLLGNYFPGYSVTTPGAFLGFIYAFVVGYVLGRIVGRVYNLLTPR